MDDKLSISIKQTQGIGSSGEQSINIDNSVHNYYPKIYQHLVKTHTGAITFDPVQLRKVVEIVAENYEDIEQSPRDFNTISIEKKNALNNLSQNFYNEIIARDYEPYFMELDVFFRQRSSEDLQKLVGKISRSLNKKIFLVREEFDRFEILLSSIEDALLDSQFELLNDKEDAITLFIYYLYANCFIGRKTEEEMC